MAVVRGFIFPARIVSQSRRVVEPELDMNRFRPQQQSPTAHAFRDFMRKLLPGGQSLVRSPMRSIAREIEEAWPSREL
ncbi:MAG TPA: hypothetical protein VJN94_11415 [Candidatus Binataceae bacterium]|nr:hypothetical protein [Candidatus Binataceae bacterium]